MGLADDKTQVFIVRVWLEAREMAGAEVPAGVSSEVRVALEQAISESFVASFRVAMLIAAGLALASALTASLTIEGKRLASRSVSPVVE